MMETYVLDDVYVYIDVKEIKVTSQNGNSVQFTNNATNSNVEPGEIRIEVNSGVVDGFSLTSGSQTLNQSIDAGAGQVIRILLDKGVIFIGKQVYLFANEFSLSDDVVNTINLTISGGGSYTSIYARQEAESNTDDVMFVDSMTYVVNKEVHTPTNIKNQTKQMSDNFKGDNFSLNILWYDSVDIPTGRFNIRITDEDNGFSETLKDCQITSLNKGASSGDGDFTLGISGVFRELKSL
jgi:hypothetical protein